MEDAVTDSLPPTPDRPRGSKRRRDNTATPPESRPCSAASMENMETQPTQRQRIPPLTIDAFQGWHSHAAELYKITNGDFHAVCRACKLPEILGREEGASLGHRRTLAAGERTASVPSCARRAPTGRPRGPVTAHRSPSRHAPCRHELSRHVLSPPAIGRERRPTSASHPPTANAQLSDPAPLELSRDGEQRTDDHGEEDDSETEKESRRRRRPPRNPANRTTRPRTWAEAVKAPAYPQQPRNAAEPRKTAQTTRPADTYAPPAARPHRPRTTSEERQNGHFQGHHTFDQEEMSALLRVILEQLTTVTRTLQSLASLLGSRHG
ncbi:uncharacterized protein LOC124371165 [Homalodisca vitripennis]|uniref:uncharacterized protein LOC124371165 n=1 Tax=Homalodisca vitripennis TaxID=197043 RepID=UPI001EE9DE63|nr:uncharacterized protein LOC124371165 [Homalodisca vitripennis]